MKKIKKSLKTTEKEDKKLAQKRVKEMRLKKKRNLRKMMGEESDN